MNLYKNIATTLEKEKKMKNKTLVWSLTSQAVGDSYALDWVQQQAEEKDIVYISTSTMFLAARVLHKRGIVNFSSVMIGNSEYQLDNFGRLSRWPEKEDDPFFFSDELLKELL